MFGPASVLERNEILRELSSFDHEMRALERGTKKILQLGAISNMSRLQTEKQNRKKKWRQQTEEVRQREMKKEKEHRARVSLHRKKQLDEMLQRQAQLRKQNKKKRQKKKKKIVVVLSDDEYNEDHDEEGDGRNNQPLEFQRA